MRLWIIDAGFLHKHKQSIGSEYEFSYLKLRNELEKSGSIDRAYYLNSVPDSPSAGREKFHHWLRSARPDGPQLITQLYGLKTLRVDAAFCRQCNDKVQLTCPNGTEHELTQQRQKGVDVAIATLAMKHHNRYDTLLLSTGDADFLDVVEYWSENGKRIELAVFSKGVATELQARADRVHWLNDFKDEICQDEMHSPFDEIRRNETPSPLDSPRFVPRSGRISNQ